MDNIYKNNLLTLSELKTEESIYYIENKIYKDDRYLGSLRYGKNVEKILNVINISFLHYYNILLLNGDVDEQEIIDLLNSSISGLENFKTYTQNNNMPIDKIDTLLEVLKKHINDLETNRFVKSEENIKNVQDNIDIIRENMEEVNLEEDNEKPKSETCNSFIKMILGIRESITGFFLSIYNHLFVY